MVRPNSSNANIAYRSHHWVDKVWGKECWITNTPLYCGKVLYINQNCRTSVHFHKLKDEHMYVAKGSVAITVVWPDCWKYDDSVSLLEYGRLWSAAEAPFTNNNRATISLAEGDSLHLPPYAVHKIYALDDSEVIEFSTQHFDDDSYRLIEAK